MTSSSTLAAGGALKSWQRRALRKRGFGDHQKYGDSVILKFKDLKDL